MLTRALACRYDFFKAELLKSGYFQDNIYLHTTASFAAGTVATTVCSPADVLKVRPPPAGSRAPGLTVTRHPRRRAG